MRQGDRSSTVSRGQRRLLSGLIAVEVALSCVLLVGAGLTLRSFIGLASIDPGFDPAGIATISVQPPDARYDDAERARLFRTLVERLEGMPGVRRAGAGALLPLVGTAYTSVRAEGQSEVDAESNPDVHFHSILGEYFAVLGIPILQGRDFEARDLADSEPVAIVSEGFARRFFPDGEAIGRRVMQGGDWRTIVGIVGDVHQRSLQVTPEPQIYLPYPQDPWSWMAIVVRVDGAPEPWLDEMRAAVAEIDPALAPYNIGHLEDFMGRSIAVERLAAVQGWLLALVATVLAAVGLYGVVSYIASQRVPEFGIRMAFGARRRDLQRIVLADAARVLAFGLAPGIAGSLVVGRILAGELYGVAAFEPLVFAAVLAILAVAAAVAALLPARRTAALDPTLALRDG